MGRAALARTAVRARARLNMAPRLRSDETISSWLERFAAAYGLKLGEFMRWLGYPSVFSYGCPLIDLDAHPPNDLGEIMAQHTGIAAHTISRCRLVDTAALPVSLRRTFCPQCWMEDGPYRRREWASGWSLVCVRHRCFLDEKPALQPPVARHAEDPWVEFWESPRLWRRTSSCWKTERWTAICDALGVNPQTEFLRAYFWLRDLAPVKGSAFRTKVECDVKRDLVIYGLLKFRAPSLLQTLDPTIASSRLIRSESNPTICGIGTPEAEYSIRLFAAVVAQHLWERLTQGRWRCRYHEKIEACSKIRSDGMTRTGGSSDVSVPGNRVFVGLVECCSVSRTLGV